MLFSEDSPCHPSAGETAPALGGLATIATADAGEVIASLATVLAPAPRPSFLTHCALAFERALCADYVIISPLNPYSNIMRTMRFVAGGKLEPNISYSLDGTPCARAMESGVCVYPENVAALFPRDRFLSEHGISGYVGAAMRDRAGNPLGVMLALSRPPIAKADAARAILQHFSARVACAIDTAELIERQHLTLAVAADGAWDWDVVTGGTALSDSVLDLLGLKKRGFYDLTYIENAIHPEDRPRYAEALRAHANGGAPLRTLVRLNTARDGWRWFLSRGEAVRDEKGRAVRMIGCFIDASEFIASDAAMPQAARA